MKSFLWTLAAGFLVSGSASLWLYYENGTLREELTAARALAEKAPPACETEVVAASPPSTTVATREAPPSPASAPVSSPAPPPEEEEPPEESRAQRRKRRQEQLAAFLGRGPGETEEEYRNRLAPLITMGLAEPRKQLEEARDEAEEAAGVTEEQSKELDTIFAEVYEEAVNMTNLAIANGDLTPYKRNAAGVMTLVGGMGTLLAETEARLGEVLTAEQLALITESGFDWAEYLGVNAPWETLNPPPPADSAQ